MRDFSAGAAIMSGFRLIGREPLAFLAWALVYGIVGLAPQGLIAYLSFTAIGDLSQLATPSPGELPESFARAQALQPLSLLSSAVSTLLIYGAVSRAILYPDDRRFLYLRLTGRELWAGLNALTVGAIYVGGLLVFILLVFILAGITAVAAGGGAVAGAVVALIAMPAGLAGLVATFWVLCRLSLSMPMGFAQRNFRIPDAWRATRGRGWRIFGVMLAIIVITTVGQILVMGVGASLVAIVTPLAELGRAWTTNPARVIANVPPTVWLAVGLVTSLLSAASATLFGAALTQMHKDMAGPDVGEVFA